MFDSDTKSDGNVKVSMIGRVDRIWLNMGEVVENRCAERGEREKEKRRGGYEGRYV
jgi:hypothetical protein